MDPAEFTVGWICALPLELAAAQGMLEEKYDARELPKHPRDSNQYSLGQIAGHKVVLTCLPSYGNNKAGSAANHMNVTFENLAFTLMVGIGGGIPFPSTGQDVRLGDVVVSMPSGAYGGVIQHDAGKALQKNDFQRTGALAAPPQHLQSVVRYLMARHESEENCIAKHIKEMLQKHPKNNRAGTDYRRPSRGHDLLFKAEYVHEGNGDTCADCDKKQLVARHDRLEDGPVIHYGNIASGSSVVRDALKRDQLGKDCGTLCVEMEAAGLMDEIDCLVIRGICDYTDSHKNKDWQRYAAAAAAAYAKELLGAVSRPNIKDFEPSLPPQASKSSPLAGVELFMSSAMDPPHPPQRFAIDPPSSQSPRSTRPIHPPPSPKRPSVDKPSKAPSRSLAEGAWEGRGGEYVLVEAPLYRYWSHGSSNQNPDTMGESTFRIFELVNDKYSIPTRRIAIRSREHEEQFVSYWMPLDNVHVKIEDRQVTISWSACSHVFDAMNNYRTTFSCQYIPENRNRVLIFECEDVSVIQRVADVLLYPTLENSHYEQHGTATGNPTTSTLRVYKHPAGAVPSNLCADQHPEFAILISSNAADSTRSSKLYFGRPCLDFQQDKRHDLLILNDMRCLNYESSLKKPSEKDLLRHMDPEGGPDMWDLMTEDLKISLIDYEGLTVANLMEVLTGWRLRISEDAPVVSFKNIGRLTTQKKMKGALVTVWERDAKTGKDFQLLIRTSSTSGESKDILWLSASLSSLPVDLTIPEVRVVEMKVKECLKGKQISINEMSVDISHVSEPKARAQKIRLQFHESNHANRFYNIVTLTQQSLGRTKTFGDKPSMRQRETV